MHVLIIEDELRAAERLEKLIQQIDPEIRVLAKLESVEESIQWFRTNEQPELIFLDIHLSDGLSFNIFTEVELSCPVIFTTAYDEYALRAFDLNSIDYLLKPIDKTKLEKSIAKYNKWIKTEIKSGLNSDLKILLNSIKTHSGVFRSRFLISKNDAFVIIQAVDIAYFYSEDKLTFIKTKENKRYILDESLDGVMESLDPKHFFRINRQLIISVHSIKSIESYFNYKLKLEVDPPAPHLNTVISRSKTLEFKEWVKNG